MNGRQKMWEVIIGQPADAKLNIMTAKYAPWRFKQEVILKIKNAEIINNDKAAPQATQQLIPNTFQIINIK